VWALAAESQSIGDMFQDDDINLLLPFAVQRGKKMLPVDEGTVFRRNDVLHVAIWDRKRDEAEKSLKRKGWTLVERQEPSVPSSELTLEEETNPRWKPSTRQK
jgi:hypothetical protein